MFKVFDCGRTRRRYSRIYKEHWKKKKKKIGPYLYCQYLQIWKQPSRRQTLNLVPREVEFSQSRQEQAEAFEIIVTQIQHLYRIK